MNGVLHGVTAKCRAFSDFLLEANLGKELDLPQIAALGDTSSGKSSVLSAISSVVFPSRNNITTRCPTRLCMDTGDSFRCKMQVIWHSNGASAGNRKEERTISDPIEITSAIEDLQKIILDHENNKSGVSKSIIEIRLTGPSYPNLTLIDLPGIVRSTGEGEHPELIEDIKSVMEQYLGNQRCILLAVHPAHIDVHNCEVFRLTKEADPDSIRTIPVLTKIDIVERGNECSVLKLIKGEEQKFSLGFSVVKCRSTAQLSEGLTLQASLEQERAFFKEKEPWNELKQENLFGVSNLTVKLSHIYLEMIQSTMPAVLHELRSKKQQLQAELMEFETDLSSSKLRREFLSSTESAVKTLLSRFVADPILDTSSDGWTFRALVEETKKKFADHVFSSSFCQDLSPLSFEVGDKATAFVNGQEIRARVALLGTSKDGLQSSIQYYLLPQNVKDDDLFLEEEIHERTWESSCKFKKYDAEFSTEEPTAFVVYEESSEKKKNWQCRYFKKPYSLADLSTDTVSAVESMKQKIQKLRGPDLPVFLNASIFNSIVSTHIWSNWVPLSKDLAGQIRDLVSRFIEVHVMGEIKLRAKRIPQFIAHLERALKEHVDALFQKSIAFIEAASDHERHPSTFNHYFSENITKRRVDKQRRQLKSMADASGKISIATVELVLNQNSCKSIDEFIAEEMLFILDAYGKVACKRYGDDVPNTLEANFIRKLESFSFASSISDDRLESLVSMPKHLTDKRISLQERLQQIEKALSMSEELGLA